MRRERVAAIKDFWRKISDMDAHNKYIERLSISDNFLFKSFNVDMSSKLVSICGKNGIGKTLLLKIIYKILTNEDCGLEPYLLEKIPDCNVTIKIKKTTSIIAKGNKKKIEGIEYFDASAFCYTSRKVLGNDIQENGLINSASMYLLDAQELDILNRITSKTYTKVECFEVVGADDTDDVYPYFKVYFKNSSTYSSAQMGAGEYKIFVTFWKMKCLEKHTILLLEEPETFLCPLSQKRLLEFFVECIDKKKLQIILSTHSEHILTNQPLNSIKFLKKVAQDKHELIAAKDKIRYFQALGVTPTKNNIFLVEDNFAQLVLEKILKSKAEDLYVTSFIHSLDGESNIGKVSKHYVSYKGLNFVAVYDADQEEKSSDDSNIIPKIFLPGINKSSPEEEIISSIFQNIPRYAELVMCEPGALSAAIQDNQCNHHDFFSELSNNNPCFPSSHELKISAINLWLSLNNDLIEKFVLQLREFIKKT